MIRKTVVRGLMVTVIGAAVFAACRQAGADIIASQKFESYAVGSDLAVNNGWTFHATENASYIAWTVKTPNGSGNTSGSAIKYSPTSPGRTGGQAYAFFDSPAAISAGTTDYYISFYLRPAKASSTYTYGGSLALANVAEGSALNGSYISPYFGVADGQNPYFYIRSAGYGTTYNSTTIAIQDHWYEIRLQISVDATTLSNSTGTLYIRDVTAGETTFTALSDLTNINLGLGISQRNPANYTAWLLKGGNGSEFDNLEFGTGTLPVPEPASVGVLGLLGALYLARK